MERTLSWRYAINLFSKTIDLICNAQIDREPYLGFNFFNGEMVRLNITCPDREYGCLPMKFRTGENYQNSTYCKFKHTIIKRCMFMLIATII